MGTDWKEMERGKERELDKDVEMERRIGERGN